MFKELQSFDASHLDSLEDRSVVFFYTPLCGTCKVARRMLDIVDATLPGLTIYTSDANFAGNVLQTWKVQSVPALAYLKGRKLVDIQFAFTGVDDLYRRLKTFFTN